MSLIESISATENYRERCEDRVDVINEDNRTVIIVADGAGGVGSGDLAAEYVVSFVKSNYKNTHSANDWVNLLRQIDSQIGAGESTAVVVDIRPYGIAGASVGDSQAWILKDGITDLTCNQVRKPLIGSGQSEPIGFTNSPLDGLLIVATDGLFDYAKRDEITRLVLQSDFYAISRNCIDLVRLPSGDMWDDVGIVAARNKPQHRTRRTFDI
ncbi:protein phosphatase 2C family protein [Mariniblastus sp.]|nr:protein phosphatase 2C family protein [Mariniblastus sp.]